MTGFYSFISALLEWYYLDRRMEELNRASVRSLVAEGFTTYQAARFIWMARDLESWGEPIKHKLPPIIERKKING